MLKIENITYEYIKSTSVLVDFNGEFNKGLNIVLSNRGEGKTTLLDLILFPKKNQTAISLLGKPLTKASSREEISAIQANWFLNGSKTAMQNFERSKWGNKLPEMLLKRVGFEKLKTKKVESLSECEKFKLTILRALKKTPSVLILDSPFYGRGSEMELFEILKDVIAKYQQSVEKPLCTILLTRPFDVGSHMVNILEGGKIISKDSYKNIQNNPKTTLIAVNFAKYPNNVFAKANKNYYIDGDKITLGEDFKGLVAGLQNGITTIDFAKNTTKDGILLDSIETSCARNHKVGEEISISIPSDSIKELDVKEE